MKGYAALADAGLMVDGYLANRIDGYIHVWLGFCGDEEEYSLRSFEWTYSHLVHNWY